MPEPTPQQPGFTGPRVALLLGLLVLASYPAVALGLKTFVVRDFGMFGYPLAQYVRDNFWAGTLPHWNPYSASGIPFLAQWNTLCLYPGSLLYVLLPPAWAVPMFVLLHQFAGGFGMYWLVRRWVGDRTAATGAAVLFAFNGLTLCFLMWPNNIAALGVAPWLLLALDAAVERGGRYVVVASFVAALQVLAGAPEVILFTWLLGGLLVLCPESLSLPRILRGYGRCAAVGLLTLGLTAVQLLPFAGFLLVSQRQGAYAAAEYDWALPGWGLLNLLVPRLFTWQSEQGLCFQPGQMWATSYYAGVMTLLLAGWALIARRTRWCLLLATAAAAAAWLAMGQNGTLYPLLAKVVPGVQAVRYPAKFVIVLTLLLPVLAAYGLADLRSRGLAGRRRRWAGAAVAAMAVAIGLVWALSTAFPDLTTPASAVFGNGLLRLLFLLAAGALLVAALRLPERPQALLFTLFLAVLWLDLRTHLPELNPTTAPEVFRPRQVELTPAVNLGEARAMVSLPTRVHFSRVATPDPQRDFLAARSMLQENTNLLDAIPKVDGFYSLYTYWQLRVLQWLYNGDFWRRPAMPDFLGVRQVSDPVQLRRWRERPSAMPLITAGQAPLTADEKGTYGAFADPTFDPRQYVIFPPESERDLNFGACPGARVLASTWAAHRLSAEVEFPRRGVLVIAQTWYPAWHATIDAAPARILRANLAFQAVIVPPGRHRVVLVYRDRFFEAGAILTGLTLSTLLLLAGWLFAARRLRPRGCACCAAAETEPFVP